MNIDIVFFITSVNKIALLAFFITLVFIIVEIYLLLKEKRKDNTPIIPEFKSGQGSGAPKFADLPKRDEKKHIVTKPNQRLLLILIIILTFLGFLYFLGFIMKDNRHTETIPKAKEQSSISVISSSGIKLYDQSWNELKALELSQLKGGDTFIIGIGNIPDTKIDKARIRVNQTVWLPQYETKLFQKTEGVYYKEYEIATADSKLVIEAQLHSIQDGWLGE